MTPCGNTETRGANLIISSVTFISHPHASSTNTVVKIQERFRYCGAKMLPKGSMGYVEPGQVPPTGGANEAGHCSLLCLLCDDASIC